MTDQIEELKEHGDGGTEGQAIFGHCYPWWAHSGNLKVYAEDEAGKGQGVLQDLLKLGHLSTRQGEAPDLQKAKDQTGRVL